MVEDDIIARKGKEDWEIEVKDFYSKMLKIEEANSPDSYLIPKSVWNELMGKLQYFESALKDARKQRDNWRKKYETIKKTKTKD